MDKALVLNLLACFKGGLYFTHSIAIGANSNGER